MSRQHRADVILQIHGQSARVLIFKGGWIVQKSPVFLRIELILREEKGLELFLPEKGRRLRVQIVHDLLVRHDDMLLFDGLGNKDLLDEFLPRVLDQLPAVGLLIGVLLGLGIRRLHGLLEFLRGDLPAIDLADSGGDGAEPAHTPLEHHHAHETYDDKTEHEECQPGIFAQDFQHNVPF